MTPGIAGSRNGSRSSLRSQVLLFSGLFQLACDGFSQARFGLQLVHGE